jgi:hypothetical protein
VTVQNAGGKHSASSCSEAEAANLDNLLDEAQRVTFRASDPIAITLDKLWKSIAVPTDLHSPTMVRAREGWWR